MTTTQKVLVTATVTLAVSAAVYEWHRASEMEREIHGLREQQSSSTSQLERSQRERDEASKRVALLADENAALKDTAAELARLRDEVSQLKSATQNDAAQSAARSWLARVTQLKQHMEQTPNAEIPELQFVTEQDWLDAANRELKTAADYRRALSAIPGAGESKVVAQFQKALKKYAQANQDQFPSDLGQLQRFFDSPLDGAILERWTILPADAVPNMRLGGEMIITQRAPVDDVFDLRFVISQRGSQGQIDFLWSENGEALYAVYRAYAATHNSQSPDDVSQLQPYATTPEQRAALEKLILRESTSK